MSNGEDRKSKGKREEAEEQKIFEHNFLLLSEQYKKQFKENSIPEEERRRITAENSSQAFLSTNEPSAVEKST